MFQAERIGGLYDEAFIPLVFEDSPIGVMFLGYCLIFGGMSAASELLNSGLVTKQDMLNCNTHSSTR